MGYYNVRVWPVHQHSVEKVIKVTLSKVIQDIFIMIRVPITLAWLITINSILSEFLGIPGLPDSYYLLKLGYYWCKIIEISEVKLIDI